MSRNHIILSVTTLARFHSTSSLLSLQIFSLLGAPSEKTWPGVSQLPHFKALRFPNVRESRLRAKFPQHNFSGGVQLSDLGLDLLSRLLSCDPAARISATDALAHPWFEEAPRPKAREFMPTFPATSALDMRQRYAVRRQVHEDPVALRLRQQEEEMRARGEVHD